MDAAEGVGGVSPVGVAASEGAADPEAGVEAPKSRARGSGCPVCAAVISLERRSCSCLQSSSSALRASSSFCSAMSFAFIASPLWSVISCRMPSSSATRPLAASALSSRSSASLRLISSSRWRWATSSWTSCASSWCRCCIASSWEVNCTTRSLSDFSDASSRRTVNLEDWSSERASATWLPDASLWRSRSSVFRSSSSTSHLLCFARFAFSCSSRSLVADAVEETRSAAASRPASSTRSSVTAWILAR
mmetsp:Transcript_9866/g.28257  ORF Transcript_9866/g.28257 Transcript_9866/m.28257 type:complete len:249 (+) Transcript_9866:72-818(+)